MASPLRLIGNLAITVFLTVTALFLTSTPIHAGCGEPMLRLGQTPVAHDPAPESPPLPCHGPHCSEAPATPLAPSAPAPAPPNHEVKWGNLDGSASRETGFSHRFEIEQPYHHFRDWSFLIYHPPRSI